LVSAIALRIFSLRAPETFARETVDGSCVWTSRFMRDTVARDFPPDFGTATRRRLPSWAG